MDLQNYNNDSILYHQVQLCILAATPFLYINNKTDTREESVNAIQRTISYN